MGEPYHLIYSEVKKINKLQNSKTIRRISKHYINCYKYITLYILADKAK